MTECLRRFIFRKGQGMKDFVSLASDMELADANSHNLAATISHSFHKNFYKNAKRKTEIANRKSQIANRKSQIANCKLKFI